METLVGSKDNQLLPKSGKRFGNLMIVLQRCITYSK